jgi:hypothetical protein
VGRTEAPGEDSSSFATKTDHRDDESACSGVGAREMLAARGSSGRGLYHDIRV